MPKYVSETLPSLRAEGTGPTGLKEHDAAEVDAADACVPTCARVLLMKRRTRVTTLFDLERAALLNVSVTSAATPSVATDFRVTAAGI